MKYEATLRLKEYLHGEAIYDNHGSDEIRAVVINITDRPIPQYINVRVDVPEDRVNEIG